VVSEIRIYVEGGGDSRETKKKFRTGFGQFLSPLRDKARNRRIEWNVIACGPRFTAYQDFKTALNSHPEALNILLVDSEGTVDKKRKSWAHLKVRRGDEWTKPKGVKNDNCQLMVQTMEAWIIADLETLADFYGQGFSKKAIPGNQNVEEIEKSDLSSALDNATKKTQKGKYLKIRHGAELIGKIDHKIVRGKALHCDRLFKYIGSQIEG